MSGILVAASLPSGPKVALQGATLNDSSLSPDDAEVGYRISSTGVEQSYTGTGVPYSTIDTWLLSGAAADYECRLTWTGDTPGGSAISTWLACSTTRSWTIIDTTTVGGGLSGSGTIEIRSVATSQVMASASLSLSADKSA
jgi:hypothetical protein